MTTRTLQHVVDMLNAFPARNGVSTTLNPRIVLGKPNLTKNYQAHLHPDVPNAAAPRTNEMIALEPSGNVQGGWYFQNLETGDQLHARS